jgi:hypothetical protein
MQAVPSLLDSRYRRRRGGAPPGAKKRAEDKL